MKKPSYLSPKSNNSAGQGQSASSDAGYVLLLVMMVATLLLISLTAAAPSIYVEGQREKEKELIFRGEQYARAIMLFHQQFKRYPISVKELLHTNNMSFLRHAYRDPMSRSGQWRFIHATGTGIILDSKILGPPGKQNKSPLGSNTNSGNTASQSTSQQTNSENAPGGSQQSGFSGGGFSLPGLNQNSGPTFGNNQQNSSSIFGSNKIQGAFIVGVASTSHRRSIAVFDNRSEYDEWEFIGIPGAPGAPQIMGQAAAPAGGAQPGNSPFGSPGSQSNSGGFHIGSGQPTPSGPSFGSSPNP